MTYDYNNLNLRIVAMFGTIADFAKTVKQAPATVANKLGGKKPLTRADIIAWGNALMIEPDNISAYFFKEVER